MNNKILLITPPFTQLNTPYPATVFLKGYLKSQSINCSQCDLGIDLINSIFSKDGLSVIFDEAKKTIESKNKNIKRIYSLHQEYIDTIQSVMSFLQNKDMSMAYRICTDGFLPEASRFTQLIDIEWAFGNMSVNDKARHLSTLYLEDISDFIIDTITPHFGFSRYAESICLDAYEFDEIENELNTPINIIEQQMLNILNDYIQKELPSVIGFSVPFPGNLFSALRCGQFIKKKYPHIHITMGGGYVNTELRNLNESRIFKYLDYITLDDGELCLLHLYNYLTAGKNDKNDLVRTYLLEQNEIKFYDNNVPEIKHSQTCLPDYEGLNLDKYISVIEIANPMHRLWTDGRWNKLMLAHGCYWHKCSFCDTELDYIKRYDPMQASELCDKIESIIKQTKETGFHFVDEAAPPSLLKNLATEIIKRKLKITWWANIRFENQFTYDLCRLLSTSGCIGVSGGLEVASDRLLEKMNKGVSVAQIAKVTHNLSENRILVHAYLMYGFPTQTEQETINSLEMVRQLFQHNCISSAFWHKFTATIHSQVSKNPTSFNVEIDNTKLNNFANNGIKHKEKNEVNHDKFSAGLRKAVYNYMHSIGLDFEIQEWFDFRVKYPTVASNCIENFINMEDNIPSNINNKLILWLGTIPKYEIKTIKKKQKNRTLARFIINTNIETSTIDTSPEIAEWLYSHILLSQTQRVLYKDLEDNFPSTITNFKSFVQSKAWLLFRDYGLLIV